MIIGIDPGKKGGICVIGEEIRHLVPYSEEKLLALTDYPDTKAVIEKVHAMPGQGVTSMFTFGEGYGFIQGVLAARRIPYQLVPPQKWQKEFSVHSKEDSINTAKKLFPGVNLKATERSKKDSDGLADALLIAEWGRRHI